MARSKQKLAEGRILIYCRKCQEAKDNTHFYKATDAFLDANGYFSICRECMGDIYNRFIQIDHSFEKAILKMCRLFNIKFDQDALSAAQKHIDTFQIDGKEIESPFGIYKSKLVSSQRVAVGQANPNADLTFVEPGREIVEAMKSDDFLDIEYLEKIWGKSTGLEEEDYEFLEAEYGRWVGPIGNVTHGEEVLIRDICHLQNQIRKERILGSFKKVDSLIEARQKIMKDGALTPLLQNAANSGKNADCFGTWLRDIEQKMPAEWYADQSKYKDMDGVEEDKQDILRSCKNFMTNSRDFNTSDLESIGGLDDMDEDGG